MANAFLFGCWGIGLRFILQQLMNGLPHIGELIRAEMHRQGRTNIWLAQQLSCNSRTISKIFKKEVIDTYQLLQISIALQRDFF